MSEAEAELQLFLSSLDIRTTTVRHPAAFTMETLLPHMAHLGPEAAVAKNLFLRDKKKRYYLLSVRHDREVNLNDIGRKIGGAKDLRFGDEAVLKEKLKVTQGSVTAFALMHDAGKKSVQFVVDSALVDGSTHSVVYFHPMVNTASTGIEVSDFEKFLKAVGHDDYKAVTF